MAWFALSLRPPWSSESNTPLLRTETMFVPRLPQRQADVYTVRIFEPRARPHLFRELRDTVASCGGTLIVELVESRGFIFSIPRGSPSPWTSYHHGKLLEEGCIQITKVELEKEKGVERCESVRSSDDEEDAGTEENLDDHPKLRMQWTWTELKR